MSMMWTRRNFHPPFSLYAEEESTTRSRGRRAAKGGGTYGGDGLEEEEEEQEVFLFQVRGCEEARASPRELGGTVLVCVVAIVFTHFLRRGASLSLRFIGLWWSVGLSFMGD